MTRKRLLVAASSVLLSACSSSEGYEAMQSMGQAKAECDRRLTPAEQRRCEAQYARDYESYQKQREQVLSDEHSDREPAPVDGE